MNKNTKSGAASSASASGTAEIPESQENVDKIRDILFGGQMRDYEQRFREMEDLISRETARLSKDISARLEHLDSFTKKELQLFSEKLSQERKERKQDGEDAGATLAETRKAIENRIADVDEVHGSAELEIRNRIHEQANELLEMIRKNQETMEGSLRQEARRLGDEKVAREDLAGLFTEVAMRLQREFDLPDKK